MDRAAVLLTLLHGLVCGCVSVSQHALGVEVYQGRDLVVLPLRVNVSVSTSSTVVWDRKDLKKENVHIRQTSGDDFSEQNPIYANRTWMRTDALQTGDLSLTLRNPTVGDSGTYTCTVRRFGLELASVDVRLQVTEPLVWVWVLAGVLVLLLLLGAGVGAIAIRANKTMKDRLNQQLKMVEVTEGVGEVTLPCTTKVALTEDVRVEWRRSVPEYKVIHVYENRTDRPEDDYQGRTAMKENPAEHGELSLILQNPQLDDGGVYICTVYRDGDVLRQKIVVLSIKETLVETIRGVFWCCTTGSERNRIPQNEPEAAAGVDQVLMAEVREESDEKIRMEDV